MKKINMNAKKVLSDLILRPIFTEKVTKSQEQFNKYAFFVSPFATKYSIKKAINSIFNVEVSKVNIVNLKGQIRKFKGKIGKTASKKKCIVTLNTGHSIDYNIVAN